MSELASEEFARAQKHQNTKNDARRIRTKVSDARQTPAHAASRWPFELLQNALDAGPRLGRPAVQVAIRWTAHEIEFEHDGAPFGPNELAALLSGGSSKEFESEETTGRFGTGFLSTHVLSTDVNVAGLLISGQGPEWFELTLARGGDETSIIENISHCGVAINKAEPVPDAVNERPSGRFRYASADMGIISIGVSAFRQALPFLFSTCPRLGTVTIHGPEIFEQWNAAPSESTAVADGAMTERIIRRTGNEPAEFCSFKFSVDRKEDAVALCVVRKMDSGYQFEVPEDKAPRLYCRFPIRPSHFLPMNIVLDCRFDLNQERNQVHSSDKNQEMARRALAALPMAVRQAESGRWVDRHLMARLGPPSGNAASEGEASTFWMTLLKKPAEQLSRMPIVETRRGLGPAVTDEDWYVDFIKPWRSDGSFKTDDSVDRFWSLMNSAEDLYPPVRSLAVDWSATANGWAALGLDVTQIDLTGIAEAARPQSGMLIDLAVLEDKIEWLSRLIDLVGEARTQSAALISAPLDRLIPNQNGRLCSPKDLRRGQQIPERLKDIARSVGYDVRAVLVEDALAVAAKRLGLTYFDSAFESLIQQRLGEADVVEECIRRITVKPNEKEPSKKLPEGLLSASQQLLDYFWQSRGLAGSELARRLPLITEEGIVWRGSAEAMPMAPRSTWHAAAQPFADVYPKSWILAERYKLDASAPNVVRALVDWKIAHADPLISVLQKDLKDQRLRAAALDPSHADGVLLSETPMSGVALLQQVLFPSINESPATASALMGMILQYVCRFDSRWRERVVAKGRRAGAEIELAIRPTVWLADLKSRSWVPMPVPGQEGRFAAGPATAVALQRLLKSEWLTNNEPAMSLLTEHFGFDALDLRLLGGAADEPSRRAVRDSLARLVEVSGADPDALTRLASDLDQRRCQAEQVEKHRTFGLAVQEVIQRILKENACLKVELIDRGYDFEVTAEGSVTIDGITAHFQLGSWLLEVKATTMPEVRLTPLQAKTAVCAPNRFALCVVDLRGIPRDTLEREWSLAEVESRARVVSAVGGSVAEPWNRVQEACRSHVKIRNEDSLRYAVPAAVWQMGQSLANWISRITATATDENDSSEGQPR